MDDPHLANPLPLEIENSHRLIHGSRYLMWSLRFLVSLSLLSLFISYLTGISLSYSYTYNLSSFLLPLATRALERKYMFLISNGLILVFLATFRGLHDHDHHHDYVINIVTRQLHTDLVAIEDDWKQSEMEANFSESEKEEEIEGDGGDGEDEDVEMGAILIGSSNCNEEMVEDGDPKEEEGEGDGEDEEVEMEEIGLSNEDDEELNRKFDEFIRKMKEELRLEAKQYHIIAT